MAFPKLAELSDISEVARDTLQAIIGQKKIGEWQELFRSAAFDLIRLRILSVDPEFQSESEITIRTIHKGITSGVLEYDKANIEKKLGIKLLVQEVAEQVEEIVAPIVPTALPVTEPEVALRRGRPKQSRKATGPQVFIATNRTPSVIPVRQTTPAKQTITEPEGENETDVAVAAPVLQNPQERGQTHMGMVNRDMGMHAETPEGKLYALLIAHLQVEIAHIDRDLPLFGEVSIDKRTRRVRNISQAYWGRVNCRDERRKEMLLDAFTGFFG